MHTNELNLNVNIIMEKEDKQIKTSNVPNEIFETFLEELDKENISKEVIVKLRVLIINKEIFSDIEINKEIFSDYI